MKKSVFRNGAMETLEGTPAELAELERLQAKPGTNPLWPHYIPNVQILPMPQKCAFDGLEPGVYGMVCSCPKCSVQCFTTITWGDLVEPTPDRWVTNIIPGTGASTMGLTTH